MSDISLNDDEKKYLYNIGVNKFSIGDYKGASTIFQLLYTLEPMNSLYVKALAGCLQITEDYENAGFFYSYTYDIDASSANYDCMFYHANCLLKLDKKTEAKGIFESFINLCNKEQLTLVKYEKLIKRASLMLKNLVK